MWGKDPPRKPGPKKKTSRQTKKTLIYKYLLSSVFPFPKVLHKFVWRLRPCSFKHTCIHTHCPPTYTTIYIPTYMYTYIHIYNLDTYKHYYLHTYTTLYLPTYMHTYLHTYLHTYKHQYIHQVFSTKPASSQSSSSSWSWSASQGYNSYACMLPRSAWVQDVVSWHHRAGKLGMGWSEHQKREIPPTMWGCKPITG